MSLGGVRNHVTRNAQPSRLIRRRVKIFGRLTADRRAPIRVIDTPDLVDPTIRDLLESVAEDEPRLPVTVPAGDDTAFVDSLDAGIQTEPVLPPAAVKGDPADGVAPPIDWNQPFG